MQKKELLQTAAAAQPGEQKGETRRGPPAVLGHWKESRSRMHPQVQTGACSPCSGRGAGLNPGFQEGVLANLHLLSELRVTFPCRCPTFSWSTGRGGSDGLGRKAEEGPAACCWHCSEEDSLFQPLADKGRRRRESVCKGIAGSGPRSAGCRPLK